MLSVSGFGQWGPEAQRQAFAPVIHAESGLLGRQAEVDGARPNDLVMAMADSITALHGAIAVLAALRHAERTGTGQHIALPVLGRPWRAQGGAARVGQHNGEVLAEWLGTDGDELTELMAAGVVVDMSWSDRGPQRS